MPQTPKYVTDGGLAKPQPLCRTGRAPIPHELAKYEQQSPIQALDLASIDMSRHALLTPCELL